MNSTEAEKLVEKKLLEKDHDFLLVPDSTKEFKSCFAVYYQDKEYIETGGFSKMLVGHGPILVSKESCEIFETGSAYPTEYYVEAFEACGDPMATPTDLVEIFGWHKGANKVSAIKYIRESSNLNLKDAKGTIDRALNNRATKISLSSPCQAEKAVLRLQELGFKCRQLWTNQC